MNNKTKIALGTAVGLGMAFAALTALGKRPAKRYKARAQVAKRRRGKQVELKLLQVMPLSLYD